jgi:hypothetical protein
MAKKTIYRTVIMLTVLSEYPLPEGMSVAQIDSECEDGDMTGKADWVENSTALQGMEAVNAVQGVGSSLDFFQLDEEGNDFNESFKDWNEEEK